LVPVVCKPLQNLWKVVLERSRQPVGDANAVVDQLSAVLDHLLQRAHVRALGPELLELVAVLDDELEREQRVGRVVLLAARHPSLAVFGEGDRVDWK
jgi:hypothetical protein